MVNIEFLDKINLATAPWAQKFVANVILAPNYHLFAKVKIKMENIPQGEPVIFAMNHTDRFNYWPLQYKLCRAKVYPFTTVWVKETFKLLSKESQQKYKETFEAATNAIMKNIDRLLDDRYRVSAQASGG